MDARFTYKGILSSHLSTSPLVVFTPAGYSSVYSLMLVDSSEQLELMASKSEVRVW